jgi:hypothetical protein
MQQKPATSRQAPPQPLCRWRTSAETLDLIEALERIEAALRRLEQQLPARAEPPAERPLRRRRAGAAERDSNTPPTARS